MQQAKSRTFTIYLLITLLTIAVPVILFNFRSLDNNRLTSWSWVFADTKPTILFCLLLLTSIIAYLLSALNFQEKKPLVLFLASFILAALCWSEPEVIIDASRYFTEAKHLKNYGIGFFFHGWGNEFSNWLELPLVPFLYGLVFKYIGEARIHIQIVTTLFFSLTVVTTYLLGKLLWNEEIGFYGGLLLLGFPYVFTQVPLMLVDVPTMFFLMFSIYLFIRALRSGGSPLILSAATFLFLALFAKYSIWILFSILPLIFILHLKPSPHHTIKRAAAIGVIVLLLSGLVLIFHLDTMTEQIRLLIDYQRPALKNWGEDFSSTFLFQIHPYITMAAICSVVAAARKKDPQYLIISFLIVLTLALQVRRIRYILPVFPMLALMAAYGLQNISDRKYRKYIAFSAVGSSLVLVFGGFMPFLQTLSAVNIQQAGAFLDTLEDEQLEIYAIPDQPPSVNPLIDIQLLDLFTDKQIQYRASTLITEPKNFRNSPFRFTWEQKVPIYYTDKPEIRDAPMVVLSHQRTSSLPSVITREISRRRFSRVFEEATDLFGYKTRVAVYYNE